MIVYISKFNFIFKEVQHCEFELNCVFREEYLRERIVRVYVYQYSEYYYFVVEILGETFSRIILNSEITIDFLDLYGFTLTYLIHPTNNFIGSQFRTGRYDLVLVKY